MAKPHASLPEGQAVERPQAAILALTSDDLTKNYRVVASSWGSGCSQLGDIALTPWEGPTPTGLEFHVRDVAAGRWWTPGRAGGPLAGPVSSARKPGLFRREQEVDGVRTTVETCVLAHAPAELRRVIIHNTGRQERRLDVTSVAEIVLDHPAAFSAHPSFSKLFIQTAWDEAHRCLLVSRRPRSAGEKHPLLFHALLEDGPVQWETDRARFLGRGRAPGRPAALEEAAELSGTVGNVLDPVVALRRPFVLGPGQRAAFHFVMGALDGPAPALELVAGLRAPGAVEKAFQGAAAADAQRLRMLQVTPEEHAVAEEMAAFVLSGEAGLRGAPVSSSASPLDPALLTDLGLDPGRPLVVVSGGAELAASLARQHAVWTSLGLPIQLAILDQPPAQQGPGSHEPVYLGPEELGSPAGEMVRALLLTMADVVAGPGFDPAGLPWPRVPAASPLPLKTAADDAPPPAAPPGADDLELFNGLGGFRDEGREYTMVLAPEGEGLRLPPRPWTNVLANEEFGCLVSETGATAAWFGNSREHRLTPWFNDPVLDPHGEALWLRDEGTGTCFSCLPGPTPGGAAYTVTHGQGYTTTRREQRDGLSVECTMWVDARDPVRLTRVRLVNGGDSVRKLTVVSFSQLVLGGTPADSSRFVATEVDREAGGMLASSRRAGPLHGAVAWATLAGDQGWSEPGCSGDAGAFRGADAPGPQCPPAGQVLDGRTGLNLSPCFGLQRGVSLAPGETAEVILVLGMAHDRATARRLLQSYAAPAACTASLEATRRSWRRLLDGVQIETPARELDLMVNGWLGYQTLACRLMGRTAFYQSGGAYGFRDQMQDSLSLLPMLPGRVRGQILLNAGHQFVEGDVLHWWHPPLDKGIRTRFADDLLWLPLAVVEYLEATGDTSILAEQAPYLKAPLLQDGQDEVFLQAAPSGQTGSVFEHCCRALDRSLTRGSHGLPLFGTGDWNDGMNRVGREGRGESVWMGFFLVKILDGFIPLCQARGETQRAARYRAYRDEMIHALNDGGWDGGWYRRGYYDSGHPLGSWENRECAIDALAQAWSVLSGAAPAQRGKQAMAAVEKHLVDRDNKLIRLLTPPFVDTPHDPGYIKGYVAGVRENGGQYTHAALWVVRALAEMGQRNKAAQLLTMLTPVLHGADREGVARYQVEPYVVAADVYGAAPHVGRGGWTWYTGSSGWMLRVALESVLGLRRKGNTLVVAPCVPDDWPGYTIRWRVPLARADHPLPADAGPDTVYEIVVSNPESCSARVVGVECDGAALPPVEGQARLPLARDGQIHHVKITLGPEDHS